MKGHPYLVWEISYSKTGKHGISKVLITGINPFTGIKREEVFPLRNKVDCPYFRREDCLVVATEVEHRRLHFEQGCPPVKGWLDMEAVEPGEEDLFSTVHSLVQGGQEVMVTVLECMGLRKAIHHRVMSIAGSN